MAAFWPFWMLTGLYFEHGYWGMSSHRRYGTWHLQSNLGVSSTYAMYSLEWWVRREVAGKGLSQAGEELQKLGSHGFLQFSSCRRKKTNERKPEAGG